MQMHKLLSYTQDVPEKLQRLKNCHLYALKPKATQHLKSSSKGDEDRIQTRYIIGIQKSGAFLD